MLSKQFVIHQGLYHLRRGVHSLMFPGVDYGTRACLQDCSPQKKHVKALHKYKKVIQEAIQQGILGEDTTLLQVTDVSPGDRPNLYEVRCALPCLVTGDALSQARALELAVELECKVNGSSTDFRKRLSSHKIPKFTFTITSETGDEEINRTSSSTTTAIRGSTWSSPSPPLVCCIKPNNVYGLPRDELLQKIRSACKRNELDTDHSSEQSETDKSSSQNQQVSAMWARLWKERQDWRAEARRERRHLRQTANLHRLTLGAVGRVDVND
ncbi:hypothetical protein CRM22_009191 [Opisthorchis felineus]|uniref:Uncharacterized protein n=1 Tax=Opisthorchis felineus TaxID=147828 RepID=A0A4S2L7X1_OPIFE|nr:hypothetical protein CRM22_009191 [Opisthorchis felineus]